MSLLPALLLLLLGFSFSPTDAQQPSQEKSARNALKELENRVNSRNKESLEGLFVRVFFFESCGQFSPRRNITEFSQFLLDFSNGASFKAEYASSVWIGQLYSMEVTAVLKSNGKDMVVQLNFQQFGGKWLIRRGIAMNCYKNPNQQKNQKNALLPKDTSLAHVKTFLGNLRDDIHYHSPEHIAFNFEDRFTFKGCQGTYDKNTTVQILNQIHQNFKMNIIESNWISEDNIRAFVEVSGFQDPMLLQITYSWDTDKAVSGEMIHCFI